MRTKRVPSSAAFHVCKSLLFEISLAFRAEAHVVVLSFDVIDFYHRHHVNIASVANQNTVCFRSGRASFGSDRGSCRGFAAVDFLSGTIESLAEPFCTERLKQIVDGVDVERADRVLVIGSNEDDIGLALDQFEDFEPVKPWHLNIQQQEIRLEIGDGFDGFKSVFALAQRSQGRESP